jgi:hypothetical protein
MGWFGLMFMWITGRTTGEKTCRKKYFFDTIFASYFAVLTTGNIRLTKK